MHEGCCEAAEEGRMNQSKSSAELSHLHRVRILTGAPELVPFTLTQQQGALVRGHLVGGFPTAGRSFLKHLVKR
jgi:hypothetical protein